MGPRTISYALTGTPIRLGSSIAGSAALPSDRRPSPADKGHEYALHGEWNANRQHAARLILEPHVEVVDGSEVSLRVQSRILVPIDCGVSGIGLNDIKGWTDASGKGWTCDIASRTVSFGT